MATENEQLVTAGFEALATGGVDALLEYVHPDFEMETLPGIAAEPQVYRGKEGVRRWFESFYEVMDEVMVKPMSAEELADGTVLAHFELRARGQHTGIEVNQQARAIGTVRDSLMIKLEFLTPEDPRWA